MCVKQVTYIKDSVNNKKKS